MTHVTPSAINSNVLPVRLTERNNTARPRMCSGSRSRCIDVTRAANRLDGLGFLRVVLDLAAQPCDVQIDTAIERVALAMLRHVENLVPRQHAPFISCEGVQQLEFHRRD